MKRAYYGANEKELISEIRYGLGNTHVIYCDGYGFDVKSENAEECNKVRERFKDLMLEQAVQRRDSNALEHINKTQKKALKLVAIETGAALTCLGLSYASPTLAKILRYISAGVAALAIENAISYIQGIFDKRDLKKYELFLEAREEIERFSNDPWLFEATSLRSLDITNLDKCSLRELRIILRNLEVVRDYSRFTKSEILRTSEDEKDQVKKSL